MNIVPVKFKILREGALPLYKHVTDACADCFACISDKMVLAPGKRCTIPLGFAMELPVGWKAVIVPRSGLAKKDGIVAITGTIDEDYRGELGCTLCNFSDKDFVIEPMDRVCQIGFEPYYHAEAVLVNELSDTERGSGGFGSTGVK